MTRTTNGVGGGGDVHVEASQGVEAFCEPRPPFGGGALFVLNVTGNAFVTGPPYIAE